MTITGVQRVPVGSTANFAFHVPQVPFSVRSAWIDLSPVTAGHTTSSNAHLVEHQRAITPVPEPIGEFGTARGAHRPGADFDAPSGQGLRERSYTWTTSCCRMLAPEFAPRHML